MLNVVETSTKNILPYRFCLLTLRGILSGEDFVLQQNLIFGGFCPGGLCPGFDFVVLVCVVLTQYQRVSGRTDRQIDTPTMANKGSVQLAMLIPCRMWQKMFYFTCDLGVSSTCVEYVIFAPFVSILISCM